MNKIANLKSQIQQIKDNKKTGNLVVVGKHGQKVTMNFKNGECIEIEGLGEGLLNIDALN